MTCVLITHSECLRHAPERSHPESPARLTAVLDAISASNLTGVTTHDAPLATRDDLVLAHDPHHIDKVLRLMPKNGRMKFDIDTPADGGTLAAALRSVGGALHAVDLVLGGQANTAFVATRPPGHHAERKKVMGFCFFGNVAIAARHAIERHGLGRVAVVDFDVHHGNGTQDLLWNEPRSLFVSTHQDAYWPGTGRSEETGAHDNVLNIPLKAKTGSLAMREAYETLVFPKIAAFEPELLLISAGFDAHRMDKMSGLRWTSDDYAWLTRSLLDVAAPFTKGRAVSCLEGGYDLPSLAESAALHMRELALPG